ncbi:MAG TPA: GNAT family N-acetyltransferase, partial [Pseudonocardia sp.]|nr:GNAT family N-acetyltransferase [Pseudonocardia sp.]
LAFLAVAPHRQGTGVGSRLLGARLAGLDAGGRPGYLEASSPRNQRLYHRFGFRPVGEQIALPDGPRLTPMWRVPTG